MWIWFVIFSIAYVLAKIEWNRQRITRRFKHIPGPREFPIIGNILSINVSDGRDFTKIVDKICINPVVKLTFAGTLILGITDPNVIQSVLTTKELMEKSYHFDFFQLKYGLFSAKYSLWRPIRKATNPALSQTAVMAMIPVFNKHLNKLCTTIGSHVNKGTFNIEESIVKFGIEQIFETMVGYEFKCSDEVKFAFQNTGFAFIDRCLNPFYHPDFIYRHTKSHQTLIKSNLILNELYQPILDHRRKLLEFGNVDRPYFIDALIKMEKDGKILTDDLIQENFTAIILAGYETTALTMAFAILMLAMNPEIDEKLYREISEIYKDGDELSYDMVKQMSYLDMVVKETLRLFPAVPGSLKEAMADTFVENIGLIPKGTLIGIPTYKMHRDPQFFGSDALKFNPDHFLPEKVTERHPYSYLPFSGGSRNCIGMHYANVNIRMGLTKILSKYRFTTKMKFDDLQLRLGVTLRLDCAHAVEVYKR